jgi:hypothetical protein
LKLPFKTFYLTNKNKKFKLDENTLEIIMAKGETIKIKNGFV